MDHNMQMEQEANRPKWLLELENRKRKPRLAHEVGAGAPCIKCTLACPGLDLHFWRKICKNCKCSRDDHDVPDEDFPQFDLLFGPSGGPKKKSIILKRQSNEETYEWAPPDASKELAIDYMKSLPEDKLPIKGTAGAALRKQQLQKQLPLHDIDHKVCDELTDTERKQFEKYLENLKKYVGQGRVTKFTTARPYDRTLMTPANASECFSPKHRPTPNHGNSPNLRTPSSFVPKKYDQASHLSRDRSPIIGDSTVVSSKRELLSNPAYDKISSEASKLGRYHHILGDVKADSQLAQSMNILGIQNPAMNYSTVSRIPHDETCPPGTLKPEEMNASSFAQKYNQGLHLSRDTNSITNDPTLVTSKREFHSNPVFDQITSEASKLGRYHHILEDVKADSQLAQSMNNPGIQNSSMTFPPPAPQENCITEVTHPSADRIESQLYQTKNTQGQVSHSNALNEPINPALNFAQSNLYTETTGSAGSFPCHSQYQRTGGVKLDHAVDDNKPLRSHQWAKKLDKSTGQMTLQEENSMLADQMLSDALLPPSSINSNDIIASTLDKRGLSYIREKLSSKYGEKEESTDVQNQSPMKSKDYESGAYQRIDCNATDTNRKPAASQLLSSGGINPSVIHSVSQQNPVFPEGAIATVRMIDNSTINRLGSGLGNMTIQPIKQKCHQCTEDIVLGDVIVTAEQAKDATWHPGCFVCSACDELLVDLVYFYHKGKLYCGRDFAGLLEIPRCFACDELIFVREYTIAEGHNYHVKHFCCWDCDEPLAGKQYISESDRPLCLPCYQKTYAKTCSTCEKVIAADQQGVAVKNLDFHASNECFCCANCKKSLLNGRMAIKENKPFCSKECITTFLNTIKN